MTEPHPTTEAEGATVANIGNLPLEDKGAICDTEKKEGEETMDVDENKETKEKEDICGNDEGEDKKDVKEKDGEVQEDGEEKKEGEAEEDGEKNKEGEVKENVDGKNEGEVKENGGEKKEGKETKDVEEKEDGQQNGLTKLENVDGVKEDTENVNTAEAEDVKMVEVMDDDAEDVKMVDAEEDVKDEEKGGKTGEQDETSENKAENDVNREGDDGTTEEKADEDEEADGSKRKRPRAKKASQKGEGKGKKGGVTEAKELLGSPVSSIERPVRERKTVERLVEVIEKEPNREFQVEKGRGTPLKDIPNVAYKLARKKPADIKLIHQTLFGRKGKAINFKSHILQFSGFVWHESDEKQRAKMKEKLDKYVKDTLLDLCDLFDLPVSRANSRKEDLVAKLLDFLVAPHPTTDVVLPEKDQKSRKRKRMAREGASKSRGVVPAKHGKKGTRSQETAIEKESSAQETEDDDEEDEKEEDLSEGEKVHKHSESEAKETESGESADEDEDDKEDEYNEKVGKGRQDKKKSIKQRGAAAKEKFKVATSPKKSSLPTITKSPAKRSYSKSSKAEEDNDASIKVFTSKKRNTDSPKKKSTPKSNTKEKTTDKKTSRGKTKPLEVEQPSKGELRKKICEILKEVDFNTATFTDILKQLAAYYKMDLTPRKASLKLMIQEELTKLAEEAEEEEEDEDDDDDPEKEEKPEPKGKEVEA